MSEIKIDKGIPYEQVAHSLEIFPFRKMEVGDSFFVAGKKKSPQALASVWGRKLNMCFRTKSVVENGVSGTRIWRIE